MSFPKEFQHLKISLEVLEDATNNFSDANLIGHGGFGKVYKGKILLTSVLTTVAIKRLDRSFGQGTPEFLKEIVMLCQYKHPNIVSLLGFCDEGGEKILVYEYLSNKSLDLYLSSTNLSWHNRLFICHGVARGLQYLHEPLEGSHHQRILHRDIKSANILLDRKWTPKIADFGLSKVGPANQHFTFVIDNAVGTPGYCDPLYARTGFLTKESDVYSFGVVLFEVLCGRLACVQDHSDIRKWLAALARKCYEEKKLDTIIHSGIRKTISPKSLERFSAIAYQCLHINREERPSMAKIAEEIDLAWRYQALADMKLPEVPMKEIEVATDNFKTCLWETHQYQFYKGELSISGGKPTMVFIKRFRDRSRDIHDFLCQLIYRSYPLPPATISVHGYCDEERRKIIIHEYAERGSLDQYISRHNNTTCITLTWLQRLQVCVGAAHGLHQLHNQRIFQKALRSTNILLDNKWVAKVCDFMISSSTGLDVVAAKHVYSAPEYMLSGKISSQADVYSFGIVLFEVLCGRLCIEEVDGDMLSAQLVKELYEKKKLEEIVDPVLRAQMIGAYFVDRYSAIAYRCLLDDPQERPTMDVVIKELEDLLSTEVVFEKPGKELREHARAAEERADAAEERAKAAEERAKAAEERAKVATEKEKKIQAQMELTKEELRREQILRKQLEEQMNGSDYVI
uniref:serine/threonine-protein kinase Nek1-like n=1 Tax=Erigeron canadensis TaxID=72917 RepID=UPI001CB998B0|nr:serine/threonine-protein kinase Nek1-like [Erigeron canadensis]